MSSPDSLTYWVSENAIEHAQHESFDSPRGLTQQGLPSGSQRRGVRRTQVGLKPELDAAHQGGTMRASAQTQGKILLEISTR
jgi:hypothetical protein